ncbi:hypothetical protein ACFTTN_35795 [Streptomyces niveus]|uniref:hypothetical protein n=1 Tax=Streptomyces niveus TaxID=193462 RepID=UPI00363373B5
MSVPLPVVTSGRVVRVGIGTTTVVAGPQVVGVPPAVAVRAAVAVAAAVSVDVTNVPAARAVAMTVAVVRPVVAVL